MQSDARIPSRASVRIQTYLLVFLGLALVTAVELAIASLGLARSVRVPILVLLSLGKASLVAAFFMHLRSDSRLYLVIFITPVILILAVAILFVIA
ncbi:MAG TPA: cytochrome C oxidase subunit IV family protein [Anaerolineales bacterium]|nr:cytochrome C oxidase subunit IV family protein [Anaerolineales bacterium]